MIRWVQTRLIVEKPVTHEKYYPTVLNATTQKSYPFSVSYADIELASNLIGSTSSYISQFRFDDIIILQVSIKYNPNQVTVWQTIFEGRIVDISCDYSNNNNVKIHAQGHESIAETSIIGQTKSYTSQDARDVLFNLASLFLTRLTYSSSYADAGIVFPQYDTTANQTFISDLFTDMEKTAGYDWAIKMVPVYQNGNYYRTYIQWKPFPTTPTTKYKIKEGTSRVISASFAIDGGSVRTRYRVNGDTPSGGSQYTNYYEDHDLGDLYGVRTGVETQTWIKDNALCLSIATGLVTDSKNPKLAGQVTLIGTPEADICDLVPCKFPSIDINGSYVNANLYVKRVSHIIDGDDYLTTLDLGQVKRTVDDFIGLVASTVKTCKKNQVK